MSTVKGIPVCRMAVGMLLLGLIKTLITVWELVTNWAYSLLTSPGQKLQDYSRVLSAPQEEIKEKEVHLANLDKKENCTYLTFCQASIIRLTSAQTFPTILPTERIRTAVSLSCVNRG